MKYDKLDLHLLTNGELIKPHFKEDKSSIFSIPSRHLDYYLSDSTDETIQILYYKYLNDPDKEEVIDLGLQIARIIRNYECNPSEVRKMCRALRNKAYNRTNNEILFKINLLIAHILSFHYSDPRTEHLVNSQFTSSPLGNNRILDLLEEELDSEYGIEKAEELVRFGHLLTKSEIYEYVDSPFPQDLLLRKNRIN